jgi:formate/nitrite transporter
MLLERAEMSDSPIIDIDAYTPARVAARVAEVGIAKANLAAGKTVALGVMAGGFIGLGAVFFTLIASGQWGNFATGRLLGGLVFCLGLILVVVAGAELFTGNNLIAMAWAEGKVDTQAVIRNWVLVYAGNFIGAAGLAVLVAYSGTWGMGEGAVGRAAARIAAAKAQLPFLEAFFRGILCNILVCLAVWLCMAARSVADKVLAIIFPITAFVALGFEHSIANLYFLPAGWLAGVAVGLGGSLRNLVAVTLGNILGGSGMVALIYWSVYLRNSGKS